MTFVVSIHDSKDAVVGTGIVVARDMVLTCAHVVKSALKLVDAERPPENSAVRLRFSGAPNEIMEAVVDAAADAWTAPPANRAAGADLCILRLRGFLPPSVTIAEILPFKFKARLEVIVVGYPADWNKSAGYPEIDAAQGTVLTTHGYFWLVRSDMVSRLAASRKGRPAGAVYAGFSGGPVQDTEGKVVALISQVRKDATDGTSYAIPAHNFPARLLSTLKEDVDAAIAAPISGNIDVASHTLKPEGDLRFVPLSRLNFVHLEPDKYKANGQFWFEAAFNLMSARKRFSLMGFTADYIASDGCYCLNGEQNLYVNGAVVKTGGNYRDFEMPIASSEAVNVKCVRKVRPPLMIQAPADCDYGDLHVSAHVFWEDSAKIEVIENLFRFQIGGDLERVSNRREPPLLSDSLLQKALARGWVSADEFKRVTFLDAVERYQVACFPDYKKQVHPKGQLFWNVEPEFRDFLLELNRRICAKDIEEREALGERGRKVRLKAAAKGAPSFLSNVPNRGKRPFVGRGEEMSKVQNLFASNPAPRAVILNGPSGVGKSEFAREYARRNIHQYPGGAFVVNCDSGGVPTDLAQIGVMILHRRYPADLGLEDQCLTAISSLGNERTLLIYDNVLDRESVEKWLPPFGRKCDVLVTTNRSDWGSGFSEIEIEPLKPANCITLIEEIASPLVARRFGSALVEQSGGLPMQLCAHAAALAKDEKRGRLDEIESVFPIASDQASSYRRAYDQLSSQAQLLLHAATVFTSHRIPRDELCSSVIKIIGGDVLSARGWLDSCQDLFLLQGRNELNMHRLLRIFVNCETLDQSPASQLLAVRQLQFQRFLDLAKSVRSNPADVTLAGRLGAIQSDLEAWDLVITGVSPADISVIGSALGSGLGRFAAAKQWYQRAVEVREKRDVQGDGDHDALGASLHEVGLCLANMGQSTAAEPWFERAIEAREKGDVHGRIHHDGVAASLHELSCCLSSMGQFAAAQRWCERAVEAAEKGDEHGHVNHSGVGTSLNHVGYCLANRGQFAAAQTWHERAVEAHEKGDVHGRVNHDGLGACLYQVGWCLASMGQFATAQPWFERAVEAVEKGDEHGRVDHECVGASLNQVGYCLSALGQFAAALPWYERAVEAHEKGDEHGRVDHNHLGQSLHQVGYCLARMDQFAAAQSWFERSLAVSEKGDVYGRVDHGGLAGSLHQVGWCLSCMGQSAAAQPWFERAVEAREKGDVHGRVDHDGLGSSLDGVGSCLESLGQFAAAQRWFERAVAAKEKGDVHGRVDHGLVGASLQRVGGCISSLGQFAAALPWYERAVEAHEKGDKHGRIDNNGLAATLRAGATCLQQIGELQRAEKWKSRASQIKG